MHRLLVPAVVLGLLLQGCGPSESQETPLIVDASITSQVGALEFYVGGNGPGTMAGVRASHDGTPLFYLGGLNPEHVHALHADQRNAFTPRQGVFRASVAPSGSMMLTRPAAASPWGVGQQIEFSVVDENHVDFVIRARFDQPEQFPDDTAALFYASYMHPAQRDVLFYGAAGSGAPAWIRMTETAGRRDSHAVRAGSASLPIDRSDGSLAVNLNDDHPWRWHRATYIGELDSGKVVQVMLKPDDRADVRLSVMRYYGSGPTLPAYDFSWVLRDLQAGEERVLEGRFYFDDVEADLAAQAEREYLAWTR